MAARLLLLCAILTWIVVRWPLLEKVMAQMTDRPASVIMVAVPTYMALADAIVHDGKLGYYDGNRVLPLAAFANPTLRQPAPTAPPRWEFMDYNDWGYGFIVALASAFPLSAGLICSLLLWHMIFDAACLLGVCWIGTRLLHPWAGACMAVMYAVDPALASLAVSPYYYYFSVVVVVAALALLVRCQSGGLAWAVALGLVLGVGTMIRATNLPLIGLFAFYLLIRRRSLALAACVVAAGLLPLLPVGVLKYRHSGHFQLTSKEVFWHTVLCGLGNWPNPWGLKWDDSVVFERIRNKYGVVYDMTNTRPYNMACKQEALALWHENPAIFIRNFQRNVAYGLDFHSVVATIVDVQEDSHSLRMTLSHIRILMFVGVLCALLWNRYWSFVLITLLLYPILSLAPVCAPNILYSSGFFPVEVMLAGLGLATVSEKLYAWGGSRAS